MFRWESPQMLWLLVILPLLWFALLFELKKSQKKVNAFLGGRLSAVLVAGHSPRRIKWKWFFMLLSATFFILALARPQVGGSKQEIRSEGFELIFAVDVSDSMMAEDVKPNRLTQVKLELSRLLDMMPGNKVGLIAFAGSSALLAPLTNDPAALKMYLDSLSPLSVSEQGTSFKSALDEAVLAFERGGISAGGNVAVTRVVLMASDGEDHEQGALEAAAALKEKKIRLFTLAYGTERGGLIPERDSMGYLRGHKKNASGEPILSQVKGEALQELAQQGSGSFYFASFGGTHLQNLVEDFNQLEKIQYETEMAIQYGERFQIFLAVGLFFFALALIYPERKGLGKIWRGRYEPI
jgi:Ca-activated chloride channel family protein